VATATLEPAPIARSANFSREVPAGLSLSIHRSLDAVEDEWRRFEQVADCTAFQTFDWLAAWQRHIGERDGTRPVIAVGSFANGETAFILPLAVEPRRLARRLCWLGQELCDYNAPLLARGFSKRVTSDRFIAAWRELQARMQDNPQLHHDWIELEKMPETIGDQINPLTYLDVTPNASAAHLTRLSGDWKKFYFDKRSSATRRRDRIKRNRMAGFGEIRFVTSTDPDDARRTLETLIDQKSRSFARGGIADMFAVPGCREFFIDLASNPKTQNLVHISRIEIGRRWIAANLGVVFGDRYYHVLASYDRDVAISRYGPGLLHLRELMAHAIGLGLRFFDFTIGDERYKLEWSDIHLRLFDYTAAVRWRGQPSNFWSRARRLVKRSIKQTPFAWRLVGQARAIVGSLLHLRAP
jgi:CelD/BcsL family acetyltransferase involved in cellulose biosynthesis